MIIDTHVHIGNMLKDFTNSFFRKNTSFCQKISGKNRCSRLGKAIWRRNNKRIYTNA